VTAVVADLLGDSQIKQLVEKELDWTPGIEAAAIGVAVVDGVVTLTGAMPFLWQRHVAAKAVLRTRGVRALANEIVVHRTNDAPSDADVAAAVARALAWSSGMSLGEIDAEVTDGTVVLTGQVRWETARRDAEREVASIRGVRWVDNRITLAPRVSAFETRARIGAALRRNALTEVDAIHIDVDGTTVTLSGEVTSHDSKQAAELAAWLSPHVSDVRNDLIIRTGPSS